VISERLTATEAPYCRSYADGEITAEFAVRPQKLEHHLAEVHRKLGVRSRTELASKLAGLSKNLGFPRCEAGAPGATLKHEKGEP
jgi:DNA-binding CsgD family transcriptional regulator